MNGYGVVKVHLTTCRTSGEKVESFCLSTFFLTQSPFYKARFEKFLSAMGYRQEFCANRSVHIDFIIIGNNSDYLQKARKYGHFTGYKN